jgi:hypothetical protein
VKRHRQSNDDILILGDFNELYGSDPNGMIKLAVDNDLVNVMESRHSSRMPATYARGRKCIDYAIASPRMFAALKAYGYEPFNQRFHTDHRPYFMDIDTNLLFGLETQPLSIREPRILRSNNISQVTQYIREKHKLLSRHNAFNRARKLTEAGDRHAFAERLDRDVTSAS